jgi:hypothetical protein
VRKRLAQYYQSPAHAGELRIELNPGSYVPVFSQPPPDTPAFEMIPAQVSSQAEQITPPQAAQSARSRKIHWPGVWIASSAILVVVAIVLGVAYWNHFEKQKSSLEKERSALEEVWSPLLTSSKPILFCIGGSRLVTFPGGSQLGELQSGADEDSFLQELADKNDFVPFSDVLILSRFSSWVQAHGHAFRIQNFRTTVSSQLREGPVVLIGALNNDWTLNRTSSLRFHFEGLEDPNSVYWIADRQHPESRAWQISAHAQGRDVLKDYAIAARFTDEGTGQVVLVAAGIAGSGTRAAGEFLTDEADLKQLEDSAGADWSKENFEVVLSSQVVNGIQGKPKVEAKTFW